MSLAFGCWNHRHLVNDDVLQRNNEFTSSSLILPNLLSNLFISFVNVLKMSSNCSTSFALSFSEMLLISAAYAELLSDMFL